MVHTYRVAIPLLGRYLKESKGRDTYTPMFIIGLFIIAMLGNQPRCPSTDECIKKMWCISTMESYSVIKNEIMSFVGK
jgi:hypothetical protein